MVQQALPQVVSIEHKKRQEESKAVPKLSQEEKLNLMQLQKLSMYNQAIMKAKKNKSSLYFQPMVPHNHHGTFYEGVKSKLTNMKNL